MAFPAPEEIFFVIGAACNERGHELWADLVSFLRNGGADGSRDARPLGSEALHRLDCSFDNARFRALPPGMNGGDDTRGGIGHQKRHAVGGENAYGKAPGRSSQSRRRPGVCGAPWRLTMTAFADGIAAARSSGSGEMPSLRRARPVLLDAGATSPEPLPQLRDA